MQAITASGKDIPVVAVSNGIDDAGLHEAQSTGARNIALRHKPQQLLATVRREWDDLGGRRALRSLEARVRETERRCDTLIESSRDPIAYVHQGMHIRANSRSEEHTSELQSLMRISYAVFCLTKTNSQQSFEPNYPNSPLTPYTN